MQDWIASRQDRILTFGVMALLIGIAIVVVPFSTHGLAISLPLLAIITTATAFATGIAAFLLTVHARAEHSLAMTVLALGFALATIATIGYLLSYPGIGEAVHGSTAQAFSASSWLRTAWHGEVASAIIIFYVLGTRDAREGPVRRLAILGAMTAFWVIVMALALATPLLPAAFAESERTGFNRFVQTPLTLALCLAAGYFIWRTRRPTVFDNALGVLTTAMLIDVGLRLASPMRFTLSWYFSRYFELAGVTAILTVLLIHAARQYGRMLEQTKVLAAQASTDVLTELPNRRRFDEELARAHSAASRRDGPLSVAVLDIDRFKRFNDFYGHQAGDRALQAVGTAIAASAARRGDFVARFGGEEFVMILEDTDVEGAAAVAERVRMAVSDLRIKAADGRPLSVSIGVAQRIGGESAEALLGRADAALYLAKNKGRNRVVASRNPRLASLS